MERQNNTRHHCHSRQLLIVLALILSACSLPAKCYLQGNQMVQVCVYRQSMVIGLGIPRFFPDWHTVQVGEFRVSVHLREK